MCVHVCVCASLSLSLSPPPPPPPALVWQEVKGREDIHKATAATPSHTAQCQAHRVHTVCNRRHRLFPRSSTSCRLHLAAPPLSLSHLSHTGRRARRCRPLPCVLNTIVSLFSLLLSLSLPPSPSDPNIRKHSNCAPRPTDLSYAHKDQDRPDGVGSEEISLADAEGYGEGILRSTGGCWQHTHFRAHE